MVGKSLNPPNKGLALLTMKYLEPVHADLDHMYMANDYKIKCFKYGFLPSIVHNEEVFVK